MSDRQRLNELAVSDTGFVFDPLSGATFNTNASGLSILEGIKRGKGRDEIVADLEEAFEVGEADLHRDVDELVVLLRDHGLVGKDFRLDSTDA